MKEKIGVFFDWDGTLCDSLMAIWRCICILVRELGGTPPTLDEFLSIYDGRSWEDAYESWGCGRRSMQTLHDGFRRIYAETTRETPYKEARRFYAGAAELLREMTSRDNTVVGIISGEEGHHIESMLSEHAISCDFVDGDNLFGKAATITSCITEFGLTHDRTVYVGDIEQDMLDAHEAGVIAVGCIVGHPQKRIQLERAGAHKIVSSHEELAAFIASFRA